MAAKETVIRKVPICKKVSVYNAPEGDALGHLGVLRLKRHVQADIQNIQQSNGLKNNNNKNKSSPKKNCSLLD